MKVPKAYSSRPIRGIEEGDKYLNPVKQVQPVNQTFVDNYYHPFIKEYNRINFDDMNTDEKLNLLFETLIETKNNLSNTLTLLLAILLIILLKITLKR